MIEKLKNLASPEVGKIIQLVNAQADIYHIYLDNKDKLDIGELGSKIEKMAKKHESMPNAKIDRLLLTELSIAVLSDSDRKLLDKAFEEVDKLNEKK